MFLEAADRLRRVLLLWFQPVGALREKWGQLQTIVAIAAVFLGGAAIEAITRRAIESIPDGVSFAVAAPSLVVLLGLLASWRQQKQLDGKPDEIDNAIQSLTLNAFEVNAFSWDQATVFRWVGEELVLKHLSVGELAILVARKMRMRNFDSVKIDRVLSKWVLAGLLSWELVTPVPANSLGGYPIGASPYNVYQLTALGKRVLARLRDVDSAGALKKSAEPVA